MEQSQSYDDPEIYGPFNEAKTCLVKLKKSTPGFYIAVLPLMPE